MSSVRLSIDILTVAISSTMDRMKWVLLTGLQVLLIATQTGRVVHAQGSNAASIPSDDINQLLNQGMVYVYSMANTFLEKIVQTKYLTEMSSVENLNTIDTLMTSVTTSWSKWIIYMIGFVVCVALGLVLVIVMLLACLCFPCCRCCGKCGAVSKKSPVKGSSKCRTCGCSLALVVMAAGLVVGVIAMYGTNEALATQLQGPLFDNINNAFDGVTDFLDQILSELNTALYVRYLETENVVFRIIEDVPDGAIKAVDNATGAVTVLNQLKDFTGQLDQLQQNLLESEFLADSLHVEAVELQKNLSTIVADITSALSSCIGANCATIGTEVSSTKVAVDFAVVNVTYALVAVNFSLSSGLSGMVDDSLQQLTDIKDSINSTVSSAVTDMKTTAEGVESDLLSIISDINSTLEGIDMSSIKSTVSDVRDLDMYKLATEVAYWVLLGLACVVVAVILLDLLGLLAGWCLPSGTKCGCNKFVGYHLLMTGTAFTLIFYWIFTLLVAILFVVGGPIHTEFCRNIVNNDQPASQSVLSIYDGWVSGLFGQSDLQIRPFEIYSACEANESFYAAFNLAQLYNVTAVTDDSASKVKEATDKFKDVAIDLPDVNLTNPTLNAALKTLDDGLSESNLNFTNFYVNIEGNITDPDLLALAADLDAFQEVNLTSYAADLRSIHQDTVLPMSAKRDDLVKSLQSAEAIVHLVSFSEVADTLTAADSIIRDTGADIVSAFVNTTADTIYGEIEKYVTGVQYNLENEVARCAPLYQSLKTVFDAICVQILYPLNGYWFGLGCCIFFLIPNIFLSVKLAAVFKIGSSVNGVRHRDSEKNA